MTQSPPFDGAGSHRFWSKRFIRTGVLALALGVSLGILFLPVRSFVPAAQWVLSVIFVLVGLEVILVGTYQVATGKPVPTTRWTSFLFGVRPPPTSPSVRPMRLFGGLLLLVGLLAYCTVALMWLSPHASS
jgi:hypothetical protein